MNVASENQPAMFLGIFFCLRFAGGLDFELAPEHVPNRDGINSLFVAHNFRFYCLTIAGGLTNTRKGIIIYFPILYSPLLYYGVLKRRNSAVIHQLVYYGRVSACHNLVSTDFFFSPSASWAFSRRIFSSRSASSSRCFFMWKGDITTSSADTDTASWLPLRS